MREAAARVGLGELLARRPAQLSGGQQQRVALARAIVRNPTVYLMDEPLSNLDAQLRLQTRTELKRLHRELGTTMIYVTHDQGEAMTLGGRIAVMQRGAIVQIGAPLDLYRQPVNTFVGTFLGSPPMNLIEQSRDGAAGDIGVRAEDVVVSAAPAAGADEARVLVVEPMGSETLVTLDYRGQRLVARVAGDARFEPGQSAWIDAAAGPRADLRRVRHADRLNAEPDGFGVQGSRCSVRSGCWVLGSEPRTLNPEPRTEP